MLFLLFCFEHLKMIGKGMKVHVINPSQVVNIIRHQDLLYCIHLQVGQIDFWRKKSKKLSKVKILYNMQILVENIRLLRTNDKVFFTNNKFVTIKDWKVYFWKKSFIVRYQVVTKVTVKYCYKNYLTIMLAYQGSL